MSDELASLMRLDRREQRKREHKATPEEERKALKILNREARASGATLATGGKGGLPASLVLNVMRRDGYTCKKCGTKQGLIVHHKGGLENPTSLWLKKKAKSNDPNNIVTLCEACHDDIHVEDRDT